eukprot:PLAT13114.1.p1 GENE.PLAT13114.1~~PLAT13114.1.p1  ORF type:complete len:206 (+),score=67.03 PLAT13114.1:42-659(+)
MSEAELPPPAALDGAAAAGSEAKDALTGAFYTQLRSIAAEDADREGLVKTPARAAAAFRVLTGGYEIDPVELLEGALFAEGSRGSMVLVKDIDFYSLCEHHLLPFFGKAAVAYLPTKYVTGLSKVARVVDVFARRLQVQERLTKQVGETIATTLEAEGVFVVIEAAHMCMSMRGVEKASSKTRTIYATGKFEEDAALRQEVLMSL